MAMRQVFPGEARADTDGCRRYLPAALTFDSRATILTTVIEDSWDPAVADQWAVNQRQVKESLLHEFGVEGGERKIQDFGALGPAPWSVVALHNSYLSQVRSAFVSGSYYPALLGASGLGERILNHLILALRDDYDHPATKKVAGKRSIANWATCISALEAWGVLGGQTARDYQRLMTLRHSAVHYKSELDDGDARTEALESIQLLQGIVQEIFQPLGGPPLFIAGSVGHSFLKLEAENLPLVRRFYMPASVLVSPRFQMRPNSASQYFDFYDDEDYCVERDDLTDDEFVAALER